MKFSRRATLAGSALTTGAMALGRLPGRALAAESDVETHGLSSFGELALAPDFKNFG